MGAVVLAAAGTLVGIGAWRSWVDGLLAFQDSQRGTPGLYESAIPRYVGYQGYVAAVVVLAAVAFVADEGMRGLAGLTLSGACAPASPAAW